MTEPGWNGEASIQWLLAQIGHISIAVKGVIRAFIAITTVELIPRMTQENSLIFVASARKFSGLWASKGMGNCWVKSPLARLKVFWHFTDLQEIPGTSLDSKLMAKPVPPSFYSCGTQGARWSWLKKSLPMLSFFSTRKLNLVFLRKELVMFLIDINWHNTCYYRNLYQPWPCSRVPMHLIVQAYSFMVWFANENVRLSNSCIRKGYWRCIYGAILRYDPWTWGKDEHWLWFLPEEVLARIEI